MSMELKNVWGSFLEFLPLLVCELKSTRGAWVAQSVKHPTWTQVMISQFVGLSPMSGSVLTTQSLEPASDSVSPSLSAPTPLAVCLSLSPSKINTLKK